MIGEGKHEHKSAVEVADARVEQQAGAHIPAQRAVCTLCPHACSLADGQRGLCRARRNVEGVVVDENYGRVTALAFDPIEKKPLARFHPGSSILSVGSYGCNVRCPFCQNADIANADPDDVSWREVTPEALVDHATRVRGNIGIAYTYNEPLVGFEFVRDTARLAHEEGLCNVIVSNGMINDEPLRELLPLIDAANIDLKGFSQAFYDIVGGDFATVQHTIATLVAQPSCHVEVTTLVIPGLNDSAEEIEAAAAWLASLDPEIPYHLTRFFPCHHLQDRAPTPLATLHELADVARKHLHDVQLGNC